MKVGIISIHSAPYKDSIYSVLSKKNGIELSVFTLYSKSKTHDEWKKTNKLPYINTYSSKVLRLPFFGDYHRDALKFIKNGEFDVVLINGYYPLTCFSILRYLRRKKIKYVYSADTVASKPGILAAIKRRIMRSYINDAISLWVPGKKSLDYHMNTLRLDRTKIYTGSYTFDNQAIHEIIEKNKHEFLKVRESVGISETSFLFLFVGKLIKKRNVKKLIEAFNEIIKLNNNVELLIIGDGEENDYVIKSKSLNNNIHHIERVDFDGLHKYYSIANCYVHPGIEPFSLALVEGSIAGLPIISSYEVGAAMDVLADGENGYVLHFNTTDELKNKMELVINNKFSRDAVSSISSELINYRGHKWAASQLAQALRSNEDVYKK
ncbi:MAG: glycosyltransferase family 4 protein [Acholeplasma sp.]|nr:glycosyltransferase family 4 protein [Acholeplasma sp.]